MSGMVSEERLRVNTFKSKSRKIRMLLVDDHRVVTDGLANLLSYEEGLEVVGVAVNGREGVRLADRLKLDVILMDVVMPEMDGVEATRRIKSRSPEVEIVGLSMFDDETVREEMLRAGACAYLTKSVLRMPQVGVNPARITVVGLS